MKMLQENYRRLTIIFFPSTVDVAFCRKTIKM